MLLERRRPSGRWPPTAFGSIDEDEHDDDDEDDVDDVEEPQPPFVKRPCRTNKQTNKQTSSSTPRSQRQPISARRFHAIDAAINLIDASIRFMTSSSSSKRKDDSKATQTKDDNQSKSSDRDAIVMQSNRHFHLNGRRSHATIQEPSREAIGQPIKLGKKPAKNQ